MRSQRATFNFFELSILQSLKGIAKEEQSDDFAQNLQDENSRIVSGSFLDCVNWSSD